MEISLNHLRPGKMAQVVAVIECEGISDRLRGFGLQPGITLCCCERSDNGQETALQIGETCIRLQTRDLEKIRVSV